eukprot:4323744-Pyramimonas_sp.AAC.1
MVKLEEISEEIASIDPGKLTTEELRVEVERLRRLVETGSEDEPTAQEAQSSATGEDETYDAGEDEDRPSRQ